MNEEIHDEVQAIESIYGVNTIRNVSGIYLLAVPHHEVTLRLSIHPSYPDVPIQILGVESVGPTCRKGFGNHVLLIANDLIRQIFVPGQVCLFDLLQELEQSLSTENEGESAGSSPGPEDEHIPTASESKAYQHSNETVLPPQWAISDPVTEKKSIFIARACTVNSTFEVQSAIEHLLATDKRANKATHNISAYRIRTPSGEPALVCQDSDDDGEAAAGARLLRLLQMMDAWNVLVVVSRWYGGIKIGPARFGIINAVAREALVAGRFTKG
ncbi:MAG: hypothetical protein Q9219_004589 [cf. Caloplaca sp. 3 TL-2023]